MICVSLVTYCKSVDDGAEGGLGDDIDNPEDVDGAQLREEDELRELPEDDEGASGER